MKLRYPDFLCIGAQKAGTTWLHKNLLSHPAVWMPPLKEIHYFDSVHSDRNDEFNPTPRRPDAVLKGVRRTLESDSDANRKIETIYLLALIGIRQLDDEWYGRIFQSARQDQLCGEITPAYALLPHSGIEHIVRLNPAIKIIFVLRDPIGRAWSELRMMQKRAGKELSSLDHIIARPAFLAHCNYTSTIKRFLKHVDRGHFHLLFFDEISETPDITLERVCDFLGVGYERENFRHPERVVHRGMDQQIDSSTYLLLRERLKPVYEQLLRLDNPYVKKWYMEHFGLNACAS